MKKIAFLLALMLALTTVVSGALACTALYVGSDLTEDGLTIFARAEDMSNSLNKVMYVAPAGKHTAGEVYQGCYGFSWTFTHDSYGYTAFSDDNLAGECPDCGGTHAHTPYEEAGTNDKGVSVSATESIGCSEAAEAADPFEDAGIEEAEIVTVLLSEAATAKEGVDLLAGIYDQYGAAGGSGIFIADHSETWYIENVTGHEYIAVKLTPGMVFSEPNMSIIGAVDLDDKDNVVASPKLIEKAVNGGIFVGDADANVINYAASYNADQACGQRLKDALKFFNAKYDFADNDPDPSLYMISNIAADGSIVPLYTNIELEKKYTVADAIAYYHVPTIGYNRNLEVHIFQTAAQDSLTDTIEWVCMNNASCNAFVPYYPMLTTDTAPCLKVGTAPAAFVEEEPAGCLSYPTTKTKRIDGQRVSVNGYIIFPENWEESYYWTMDVLTNLVEFGGFSAEETEPVKAEMAALQTKLLGDFATVLKPAGDAVDAAAATAASKAMAEEVCTTASILVHKLLGD